MKQQDNRITFLFQRPGGIEGESQKQCIRAGAGTGMIDLHALMAFIKTEYVAMILPIVQDSMV
jgi:hypothetical protein